MKERILVLVKTYPNLSKKYLETVCVAGITDKNEWRRLYPIPFRQLPYGKRFRKFDWIEVETEKNSKEKLGRKESYKIHPGTINIVGHIDTKKDKEWKERNKWLLPLKNKSLEELEKLKNKNKTTLGLIRPRELIDFVRTPLSECREWERGLIEGTQQTLFGDYKSPLDKIPWKFSYIFRCDDDGCKGHDIMCEDWELLEAWRDWKSKYKADNELWSKIRQRFFEWMKTRNLHFIMGTESQFNKPIIIGVYYPPIC